MPIINPKTCGIIPKCLLNQYLLKKKKKKIIFHQICKLLDNNKGKLIKENVIIYIYIVMCKELVEEETILYGLLKNMERS